MAFGDVSMEAQAGKPTFDFVGAVSQEMNLCAPIRAITETER